jgi:hypothetical protein
MEESKENKEVGFKVFPAQRILRAFLAVPIQDCRGAGSRCRRPVGDEGRQPGRRGSSGPLRLPRATAVAALTTAAATATEVATATIAAAAVTTTAPQGASVAAQATGIATPLLGELYEMIAAPAPVVAAAVEAASTTAPTWEQASVSTTTATAAPPPDASSLRETGQPAAATNCIPAGCCGG